MLPELEYFNSFDGCKLVYRNWPSKKKTDNWVVLFHRGHEHSGRQAELAEFFSDKGYNVFAWDARGNGESEGERDAAESFSVLIRDANLFIEHLANKHRLKTRNLAVVGNSLGALVASGWVHDYAPNIRALVLAAPAFRIKLYMPFAIPLLRLARKLGVMNRVTSYVKSKVLTHDRAQQKSFNEDPLISKGITTDLLIDTYDTGTRLLADAGAITVPTLMLCAGNDWVVKNKPQRDFYLKLNSGWKEWQYYPDFFHAIFHEDHRNLAFERSLDFVQRAFEKPIQQPDYLDQDKQGYSRDQQDALKFLGPRLDYWFTRLVFKYIGPLSKGIKISQQHGFDSGSSLDHVYENTPQGTGAIGKLIDQTYLSSPGWVGIRQRKEFLDQLLDKYSAEAATREAELKVLDIACGNGRYMIDFATRVQTNHSLPVTIELRDYVQHNLTQSQSYAQNKGLNESEAVTFLYVQEDAFVEQSYQVEKQFDVIVISGLLELESDNSKALVALAGAANQLKDNGYLIYTNQPWHPQLEFIGAVLDKHSGEPWQMRPRIQAEMDALVAHVGLHKLEMLIDTQGIFTVSVAQKMSSVKSAKA